jgi:acetylornithine deacetylase/succinyl-diaminopimelate desuccinylase-like protein
MAQLRSDVPSLDAELDVVLLREGSEVPPDHEAVVAMERALAGVGIEPRVVGMTAWVEAVCFNHAGTPAICFGPGRIEDAHSSDESVAVEELDAAHRALSAFISGFLT